MDIRQKQQILDDYCNATPCYKCVLKNEKWTVTYKNLRCLDIFSSPESDIDKALTLLNRVDEGAVAKKVETTKSEDVVNRPSHYTDGKIEVIEFIEDKKLGFCLGNAIKYIARAGKKDPTKEVEDLKKADWYIKRRIKELTEITTKE